MRGAGVGATWLPSDRARGRSHSSHLGWPPHRKLSLAAAGTAWQGACARSEDPLPSGEPRELGCWRGGLSAADGRSARRKADGQAVRQG